MFSFATLDDQYSKLAYIGPWKILEWLGVDGDLLKTVESKPEDGPGG